jgi:two-component system sensor histidine kinase QseC
MSLLDRVRGSLRGRLALGLGAGALLVLMLSFVALHVLIRGELYGHLDEDLGARMHAVAEYAARHPGTENVAEFMPEFRTRAHKDFFQVWDAGGRTLSRSDSSAGRDLPRLAAVADGPTYHDLVLPDGHRGRAAVRVFDLPNGDRRGALAVMTAAETENLDALESRIHFTLLVVAVATVAAMLLIATYSIGRGLKPVDDFARSLEVLDLENTKTRLDVQSLPNELRPVGRSFSGLLDRLLDALARERRYARNVAHELRNPLAEMRLLADVGAGSREAGTCQAVIRDIGASASSMERIVEALLALTRYEAGLEAPQPEPVELAAELQVQLQSVAGAVTQRALRLTLDSPGEVWMYTDSALVRRLFANLVGNAVSHSPRGAAIKVVLTSAGEVSIANPAPHLKPEDVPQLGERFLRVDDGNHGTHAGLGLSLALAIAKVLGLKLVLELQDDGRLVATVSGFRRLEGPSGSS